MRITPGIWFRLFMLFLLCRCTQEQEAIQAKPQKVADTLLIHAPDSASAVNRVTTCVFDTAVYEHTIRALETFQPGIAYTWNSKTQEAMAIIENCDTLYLHIGGCRRFVYSARLYSSIPFDDEDNLIEEARWLAVTFFGNGFDLKYDYFISNDYIEPLPVKDSLNFKAFKIVGRDSLYKDMKYDGFSFQQLDNGRRTKITIGGYVN